PWDLFKYNDAIIKSDFEIITKGRTSASIPGSVKVTGDNIFIEESARLSHCIINTESGPVYIGKNAVVMEGCLLRGPLTVGDNASIKMGTKIYGATTIGPNCVAGGEIKNSILMGYSNKAHDGYLGDSVLGYWCNLGAGTSNSNVKNTGGEVRYTLSANGENISAGNKAGLLMGDYSRAAINTSFNTGSVVGPCCNIFGRHIPATYIPAFTWGKEKYRLDKAFRDIENWMQMKGKTLSAEEKNILEQLYKD
ncbi:MAG: glucose-1-phosphate thymidylyltransferase, partial [Ferruginibacter sp.]